MESGTAMPALKGIFGRYLKRSESSVADGVDNLRALAARAVHYPESLRADEVRKLGKALLDAQDGE